MQHIIMQYKDIKITAPENSDGTAQGKGEYLIFQNGDKKEKVVFHDYDKIYAIPGLYEHLFYERLNCNSPSVICQLLEKQLDKSKFDTSDLVVLDVGAGNGIVGEELKKIGAGTIVGLDIIEEAEEAALRDRPDVYEKYYTTDLTDLSGKEEKELGSADFNCMTIVAALGFDDIPPNAFAEGYNFLSSPGWFAFNIKEDFLEEKRDKTGFCKLINEMVDENILDIKEQKHYTHRLCQDGTPLNYFAVVAEKLSDIPEEMAESYMN